MLGRKKGVPERNTRLLREAFILAAEAAGGGGPDGLVNYLTAQANKHPAVFITALSKCMPLQVEARGNGNVTIHITKNFGESMTPEPLTIEHQTNGHGNGSNGSSSK